MFLISNIKSYGYQCFQKKKERKDKGKIEKSVSFNRKQNILSISLRSGLKPLWRDRFRY
ncbi:hypothetical protein oki143_06800 [Helicobacter pylori]